MSLQFLLIQAIGVLGTISLFLSFQCKTNKNLFRVQFLAYLCYTTHLLLLGAVTGCISYIINTVRSYCLSSKYTFFKGNSMCAILCALQVITLFFTWDGWWSMLPVAANIASTIGGYTHNARKIRIAGIFINSPLWVVYDIIVGSWAGILDEIFSETSMIISVFRYGWKNLDRVEN